MSDYILIRTSEFIIPQTVKGVANFGVVPSPLGVDLRVEDLSNGDKGEGSGQEGGDTSGEASDKHFLSISKIVGNFDGFGLIIDDFIYGVPDGEIAQPADEIGFESAVKLH